MTIHRTSPPEAVSGGKPESESLTRNPRLVDGSVRDIVHRTRRWRHAGNAKLRHHKTSRRCGQPGDEMTTARHHRPAAAAAMAPHRGDTHR